MSFQEIFVEHPDYLQVQCIGTWDMDSSRQCWRRIEATLRQSDCRRVLLDDRELLVETTINSDFEHARFVADLLRSQCDRFALLDIGQNSEINHFFETACVNRGLDLKVFLRENEAIEWLTR